MAPPAHVTITRDRRTDGDAVQMVDKCLSVPMSLKFDIFDAISENARRWRDTDHAKDVLGWRPTGSARSLARSSAFSSTTSRPTTLWSRCIGHRRAYRAPPARANRCGSCLSPSTSTT